MTTAGQSQKVEKLIAWLRKRGEPDSGITYSGQWYDEVLGSQEAQVRLHGADATFVADHFHGQGASDLADALTELQHRREAEAGAPVAWRSTQGGISLSSEPFPGAYPLYLAASPSGVRVKALEWVKHPEVAAWRCDSIVGRYQVFAVNAGHASWSMDGQPGVAVGGFVDDADAAKAAAQADYEARIRSALEAT